MKLKISAWLINNFDTIVEIKHFISVVVFGIIGWIPTISLLSNYGLTAEYGFFSIFGQCLAYVARFLNPKLFPLEPVYSTSTKWLRFAGNVLMSWTFGVFTTPFAMKYVDEKSVSIVAVAILIGAFYELLLKPIVKIAYKLSNFIYKKWVKLFGLENEPEDETKQNQTLDSGEPDPQKPKE